MPIPFEPAPGHAGGGKLDIFINGETFCDAPATLAELVARLAIQTQHLAIALNNEVVPACEFARTELNVGDRIEIIAAVGGG